MKKYGLAAGIVLLCTAFCFFFLAGMLLDGYWWLFGIPFAITGVIFVFISDTVNKGKEKRAKEKEVRNKSISQMKQDLNSSLARDKAARDETLKNIR